MGPTYRASVPAGEPGANKVVGSVYVDGEYFGAKYLHIVADEIVVRALRSRRSRYEKTGALSVVVHDVPTHFRFCQDDPTKVACDDSSLVNTTELRLEVPDAASESSSFRYHRVTLSFSKQRGATIPLDYDDTKFEWTWHYEDDAAFWAATGIVSVPPPTKNPFFEGGPASGLGGRFWMHAGDQRRNAVPRRRHRDARLVEPGRERTAGERLFRSRSRVPHRQLAVESAARRARIPPSPLISRNSSRYFKPQRFRRCPPAAQS